jgi:hypothetical protein
MHDKSGDSQSKDTPVQHGYPFQPASSKSLVPTTKDRAAILAGTPVAVIGVLLWEDHFKVKLDTATAVAVGGVFATIAGYCWHVITTLIDRWIEKG